jgi:hypothetical protein
VNIAGADGHVGEPTAHNVSLFVNGLVPTFLLIFLYLLLDVYGLTTRLVVESGFRHLLV